jgi:LPXTG-motif cell wall-anchored protein
MRSLRLVSSLIGVGVVAATTFIAAPAMALDPLTYNVDCTISGPDVYVDQPIYAGQDAIFNFSPATCTQAYWQDLNPALSNDSALSGTASTTVAAADVTCGNQLEIVLADASTYLYLTFTGCEAAPAEAGALPNTGLNASALGLGALGLLAAGAITVVAIRRRTV